MIKEHFMVDYETTMVTGKPPYTTPTGNLGYTRNDIVGKAGPAVTPLVQTIQLDDLVKTYKQEAIKFDDGKADWTLVPFEALEGMVKVLEFGAKKYAAWNWTEGGGFKWTRVLGSCFRHLFAWARGQDLDPESGLSHIYHAQCNLLFLAYYLGNKEKFNKDDRNVR